MQDYQAQLFEEDEYEDDSVSSEAPVQAPVREDWRITLTFVQGQDAVLLRLDWNDLETMHTSVAQSMSFLAKR